MPSFSLLQPLDKERSFSPLSYWPPSSLLTIATLAYLALPLLLFLVGWLRLPFSLLFPLLLVGSLWVAGRGLWSEPKPSWGDAEQKRAFWRCFWWTFLPLAFCTLNCGAGGFGNQEYDWQNKHNIVLADLMRFEWPVRYAGGGDAFGSGPFNLVYYLGYYLPASCLGKVVGWTGANIALQVWTQMGMALLALWLVTLFGPRSRWLGVLFCVFAGADLWGQFVAYSFNARVHSEPMRWNIGANYLWWTHLWRWQGGLVKYYVIFCSNFHQLFWAPQHFLAGCLGCVLLLRPTRLVEDAREKRNKGSRGIGFDLLVFSLLPFWSPFAAIGCLPMVVFNKVRDWRGERRERVPALQKPGSSWKREGFLVFSSMCVLALLGCYFAARLHLPEEPGAVTRGAHLEFLPLRMWHDVGLWTIAAYLLFYAAEYVLLLWLAWPFLRGQAARWRGYAAMAAGVLVVLPWFQYGLYNDLVSRSPIPAILIVFFVALEALVALPLRRWRWRQFAIVFLLLGALGHTRYYAFSMARNSRYQAKLIKNRQWGKMLQIQRLNSIRNLYQEYRQDERKQLITQYIGDDSSLFARVFLRR